MLSVSTQIARGDDLKIFERMLQSVAFAEELLIFNMERTDTAFYAVCKKYRAHLMEVKTPKVVESIRAQQIQEAKGEWVLVMDFDEVVTPALRKEIVSVINGAPATYSICRRNFSLGFPLKHGGWGDDYVVRLFHKKMFMSWPTNIHSQPVVQGDIQKLRAHMEHHKDASLEQMVEKTNRYSDIESEQFYAGHLPTVTPFILLRKSVMEFLRRYFGKRGFLDGRIGLFQSLYQGYSVFISYAKLYQLQQKGKK